MPTPEELRRLMAGGESTTVEFKERFGNEAIETVGAFSNTRGGTVLIGVNDQGRAVGCTLSDESLREWANRIAQSSEPRIIPALSSINVGGSVIVVIEVQRHPMRPVAIRGRYYRRVDRSNVVLTVGEIAELHLLTRGTSWDLQPAIGPTFTDLDETAIRQYIRRANEVGRRRVRDHETMEEILEKLSLAVNDAPTRAAVLLFGVSPQRLLPQASVHCGVFRGGQQIIDDLMIPGRLPDQVDDAMDFIRRNTRVQFEISGDATRSQTWEYPLVALREAVVNAIATVTTPSRRMSRSASTRTGSRSGARAGSRTGLHSGILSTPTVRSCEISESGPFSMISSSLRSGAAGFSGCGRRAKRRGSHRLRSARTRGSSSRSAVRSCIQNICDHKASTTARLGSFGPSGKRDRSPTVLFRMYSGSRSAKPRRIWPPSRRGT